MMWLLVFMTYWDGQIMTVGNGLFKTQESCLLERKVLIKQVDGKNNTFPINMQAVCMKVDLPKQPG